MKGILLIISGPSGSGKGTVVRKLCEDDRYALSVSVTTRAKRPAEVEGIDYFFRSVPEFYGMLNNGELLESAQFVGNYYGTPREYVTKMIDSGKTVVLEIEVNGALQVKMNEPDAVLVFLIPPDMEELRNRLVKRATEHPEVIEDRMRRANEEVELINKYDYLVVNDYVEHAVQAINMIVEAEKRRPHRNSILISEFTGGK